MKKLTLLMSVILLVMFNNCKKESMMPRAQANFEIVGGNIHYQKDTVTLINNSTNYNGFEWRLKRDDKILLVNTHTNQIYLNQLIDDNNYEIELYVWNDSSYDMYKQSLTILEY